MLLCGTYYTKFGLKMSVCGAMKIGTPLFKMAGSAPVSLAPSLYNKFEMAASIIAGNRGGKDLLYNGFKYQKK